LKEEEDKIRAFLLRDDIIKWKESNFQKIKDNSKVEFFEIDL
jgi:hypothetical protein